MKITIRTAAIGIVVLFAGGILLSSALGFWKTESSKEVAKLKTGEFAGLPNPADIRGSYSWNDISKNFNIDVNVLLKAFGGTNPEDKVKSLEEISKTMNLPAGVELGTDSVRMFVSLYTGIPYESSEGTAWFPPSAAQILMDEGKGDKSLIEQIYRNAMGGAAAPAPAAPTPAAPTPAATAPAPASTSAPAAKPAPAVSAPAVSSSQPAPSPASAAPAPAAASPTASSPAAAAETHEEKPAYTVTGKTTFGELNLWGVPRDKLKEVLGAEPGPDPLALRDWATQNEKSFSELKTKVQELVDQVKK